MTEDEMVGYHYSLDMSLSKLWDVVMDRDSPCWSSWGHKELDTNE